MGTEITTTAHHHGAKEEIDMETTELAEGRVVLHAADCRDVLRGLDDNSIDSVVTDPPYALVSIVKRFGKPGSAPATGDVYNRSARGFMGKTWDNGEVAFAVEFWAEVLRVLKPGGHVVAFSGTRTYHRMAVAIEDAGFEIRDQLGWLYGSGFPKSHDVSKGIDKAAGAVREVVGRGESGKNSLMGGLSGTSGDSGHEITQPATPEAQQWQGWGTALKPSWEPICLARKPLSEKTVAANVLKWGAGALNIDGCRVGDEITKRLNFVTNSYMSGKIGAAQDVGKPYTAGSDSGRWPANVTHDGSDEVVGAFPVTKSGSIQPHHKRTTAKTKNAYGTFGHIPEQTFASEGSAARFFYCAKASRADRDEGLDNLPPPVAGVGAMRGRR